MLERGRFAGILRRVSVFAVVLLVAAVVLIVAAEWPRIAALTGADARRERARSRRKAKLHVVPPEADESEEFARAVERDLAALPTTDERDLKRR
jgi:hypothetical protein